MNKIRLIQKILILVLILAVPGFLYYLLTVKGKNRYHPLPIYGTKTLAKTTHRVHGKDIPDTIYHTLADFKLYDQEGKPVSLKTFDNKIFVVGFFYSHCPTVCNEMNSNIDSLAKNYTKTKMLSFVSITVDPGRDSIKALSAYATKFSAKLPQWMFLTGDTTTIYQLARKGFLVNAIQAGKDDFIYSDKLILVDQNKRIRGYYSGASAADILRLHDEIKVLIYEELRKKESALY
ncbi:MAG TPA: SCO family protein [Mucilaginibacter sp.]|nr:SCO family protein [Mucilaginibacter sp.]